MSIRMKLANWLCGGKINLYRDHRDHLIVSMRDLEDENHKLQNALIRIRNLNTPKAAHGVKRAVKIAAHALWKE